MQVVIEGSVEKSPIMRTRIEGIVNDFLHSTNKSHFKQRQCLNAYHRRQLRHDVIEFGIDNLEDGENRRGRSKREGLRNLGADRWTQPWIANSGATSDTAKTLL